MQGICQRGLCVEIIHVSGIHLLISQTVLWWWGVGGWGSLQHTAVTLSLVGCVQHCRYCIYTHMFAVRLEDFHSVHSVVQLNTFIVSQRKQLNIK